MDVHVCVCWGIDVCVCMCMYWSGGMYRWLYVSVGGRYLCVCSFLSCMYECVCVCVCVCVSVCSTRCEGSCVPVPWRHSCAKRISPLGGGGVLGCFTWRCRGCTNDTHFCVS